MLVKLSLSNPWRHLGLIQNILLIFNLGCRCRYVVKISSPRERTRIIIEAIWLQVQPGLSGKERRYLSLYRSTYKQLTDLPWLILRQQATNLTLCRRVCIVAGQSVAAGETETNWNFVVGRVIDSGVPATSASCAAVLHKRNLND